MAGASVEATDSETVASLLDPVCGIPFDVHFEIEDDAGNSLGTLGGHKAIMALKSPEFKAMLFGPMKETGKHIKIKDTSMFAFKTILQNQYTNYSQACRLFYTETLESRRVKLCRRFAKRNLKSENPMFMKNSANVNTRQQRNQVQEPRCNTSRYQKSSIPYLAKLLNSELKK